MSVSSFVGSYDLLGSGYTTAAIAVDKVHNFLYALCNNNSSAEVKLVKASLDGVVISSLVVTAGGDGISVLVDSTGTYAYTIVVNGANLGFEKFDLATFTSVITGIGANYYNTLYGAPAHIIDGNNYIFMIVNTSSISTVIQPILIKTSDLSSAAVGPAITSRGMYRKTFYSGGSTVWSISYISSPAKKLVLDKINTGSLTVVKSVDLFLGDFTSFLGDVCYLKGYVFCIAYGTSPTQWNHAKILSSDMSTILKGTGVVGTFLVPDTDGNNLIACAPSSGDNIQYSILSQVFNLVESVTQYVGSFAFSFFNRFVYSLGPASTIFKWSLPFAETLAAPTLSCLSTKGSVQVTLSLNSTPDEVRIFRSSDGVSFTQVGTIYAPYNPFVDTGLSDETRYFYKIQTKSGSSISPDSEVASILTKWNLTIPRCVLVRDVVVSRNNIGDHTGIVILSWEFIFSDVLVDGFKVYKRTSLTDPWTLLDTIDAADRNYQDILNLSSPIPVYYRIVPFNTKRDGLVNVYALLDAIEYSPTDIAVNTDSLFTPVVINTGLDDSLVYTVNLSWTVQNYGVTEWLVKRKNVTANGDFAVVARLAANVKTFADTVHPDFTWDYKVCGVNEYGSGACSNTVRKIANQAVTVALADGEFTADGTVTADGSRP